MDVQLSPRSRLADNEFGRFEALFPFRIDAGSDYEHADTVGELRDEEMNEERVRELDFSKVEPDEFRVARDCRATTLVYYWKLMTMSSEHRPLFHLVQGVSVQKKRTDPHWAFAIHGEDEEGEEEFLVDPFCRVALSMTAEAMCERDGTYFARGTTPKRVPYQYCFRKCPHAQNASVLESMRSMFVEQAMPFFPSMFGARGLYHLPNAEHAERVFNGQLREVSRALGAPIVEPCVTVSFSRNGIELDEALRENLVKFCGRSKSQISKDQMKRAKVTTTELDFDFDEMFRGSQADFLALLMFF